MHTLGILEFIYIYKQILYKFNWNSYVKDQYKQQVQFINLGQVFENICASKIVKVNPEKAWKWTG